MSAIPIDTQIFKAIAFMVVRTSELSKNLISCFAGLNVIETPLEDVESRE